MSTPTAYPQSKQTPRPINSISPAAHYTSSPAPLSLPQIYRSPLKQAGATAHNTPTPAGFGSSPLAQLEGRGRGTTLGAKSSTSNEEAPSHATAVANASAVPPRAAGLALRDISDTALLKLLDVSALLATGSDGNDDDYDEDEKRLQRAAALIQLLGPWGAVSQEGVERCVQRLGLEWTWEDGVGVSSALTEDERERTLSIAGSHLLIEIRWAGNVPQKVSLEFPDAGDWAEKSATKAADILLVNLTTRESRDEARHHSNGFVMLDAFAENLSRLANLDKLGREGISCFRAVEGLYSSFRKIWDYELDRARGAAAGDDQEAWERSVECSKTGRPLVHVDEQVGFRLAYWTDRRLLRKKRSADEMDLDGESQPRPRSRPRVSPTSYHLLIDCEGSSSSQYPSVRLSDSWVSEVVGKEVSAEELILTGENYAIDWIDPPPTLPISNAGAMDIDSSLLDQQSRSHTVRFVAHLDPPVTMPLQVAVQLFNLVGSPLMQDAVQATSYTSLTVEKALAAKQKLSSSSALLRNGNPAAGQEDVLRFRRTARSYGSGVCKEHIHRYRLFTQHNGWARTIDQIPFSHPKQLATMLPVLRQWAFVESLLKRSLGIDEEGFSSPSYLPSQKESEYNKMSNGRPLTPPSDTSSESDSANDEYRVTSHVKIPRAATNGHSPPSESNIDLTLTLDVVPTLAVTRHSGSTDLVSAASAESPTRLRFQIEPNAELVLEEAAEAMVTETMTADAENESQTASKRQLRALRALSICEDVGVLMEWIDGGGCGDRGGSGE